MTPLRFTATLAALALACAAFSQMERPVRIGDPLPPLELDYVKGKPIDRPDGNTITVVEFWATWCKPCLRTIPHLTDLERRFGEKGLQIVGVSDESAATVRPFVRKMAGKMDYRVAVDIQNRTTKRFRDLNGTIPRAYLFNEQGTLIWIGHPANAQLEKLIEELTDELNPDS